MSMYGWLVCEDCHSMTWLGKQCQDPDSGMDYFHQGSAEDVRNSEDPVMCKIIFKFLAVHRTHTLRVWDDVLLDAHVDETYDDIGADDSSCTDDQYIAGFPG